jgi:ankyrin repeat protein
MAKKHLSLQEKFNKAVLQGDLNAVEELLSDGANPNARDSAGNTPLHIAAEKGMLLTLTLLLQENTDIDARNNRQETPLMLAIKGDFGNIGVVKALLAEGCDITARNDKGQTAQMMANSTTAIGRDMRHLLRMAQLDYAQKNPVNISIETAGDIAVRRKPLRIRPQSP